MAAVIAMLVILIGWSLVAGRLGRFNVTPALAMVLAGMVLTAGTEPFVNVGVDNVIAERVVEVTLAVVLFIDATESPGGVLGREPRLMLRLLAIALPLGLLLAFVSGLALLPVDDVWVVALAAAVVVPTDLSPAAALIRDRRLPSRLRGLLNVESGLNDGIVAPVFVFCLAAASSPEEQEWCPRRCWTPSRTCCWRSAPGGRWALRARAGSAGRGGAVGRRRPRCGWASSGCRCCPTCSRSRSAPTASSPPSSAASRSSSGARHIPHDALQLTEDVGTLMSLAVWFVFGQVVDQALRAGIPLGTIVYGLLALTVVRVVPVVLSLVGTDVGRRDAVALGWLGREASPRSSSARSPTSSWRGRPASWSSRRWSSPSSRASCCTASAPRRSPVPTVARGRPSPPRHCAGRTLMTCRR